MRGEWILSLPRSSQTLIVVEAFVSNAPGEIFILGNRTLKEKS